MKKSLYLHNEMWKEKLGNYLIDVSKYTITGVVIASLFKDTGTAVLYIGGVFISVSTLLTGLILTNKKDNNRKE